MTVYGSCGVYKDRSRIKLEQKKKLMLKKEEGENHFPLLSQPQGIFGCGMISYGFFKSL